MAETVGAIQIVASINTSNYDAGKKQIIAGNKELDKSFGSVEKTGTTALSNLGSVAKTTGKAMAIGLTVAAAATTALVSSAVKAFADYEQLTGGVDTLFKENAVIVDNYANYAYKTAGLSANQYMETITGFSASLLQSLGGDTAKAAEIGNMAVTDMSDNANKMGTSMESITMAYQGFAKQNYTMLDNLKLGYGGTKTEMERLLKDAEKLPSAMGQKFDISNYSDVITAIHLVQGEVGITGTTAKEASETISGSLNSTKAAWQNMLVFISGESSQTFSEAFDGLIESAGNLTRNLVPVIVDTLSGVVDLIATLAPMIIAQIPTLLGQILPPLITASTDLVVQLVNMIPTLIPILVQAAGQLFMGIVKALPQILPPLMQGLISLFNEVVKFFTAPGNLTIMLSSVLVLLMAIVDAIPTIIEALYNAFPTIIEALISLLTDPDFIGKLVDASVKLFMALVMAIPQILGALFSAIGKLLDDLWKKVGNKISELGSNIGKGIGDAVGGAFKAVINSVLSFVEGFINTPIKAINAVIGTVDAIVPGDQSSWKLKEIKMPRLADGGVVMPRPGGIIANIAEAGEPEAVIPLSKLETMLDFSGNSSVGGGQNITINVSGVFATSKQEQRAVAETIAQRLAEINKSKALGATA